MCWNGANNGDIRVREQQQEPLGWDSGGSTADSKVVETPPAATPQDTPSIRKSILAARGILRTWQKLRKGECVCDI